jgi:Tol biopolymer transport system component
MSSATSRFRRATLTLLALAAMVAGMLIPTNASAVQLATNGRIAYTLNERVYTSLPDGTDVQAVPLAYDGETMFDPQWSPNGLALAFKTGTPESTFGVGLMQLNGTRTDPDVENQGSQADYAWSPDGTKLAYRPGSDGDTTGIWVVNEDGSPTSGNLSNGEDTSSPVFPTWSPNSDSLLYDLLGNIYLLPLDGSGPRALTFSPNREFKPIWTPDGSIVVFIRQFTTAQCSGSGPRVGTELWAVRISGGIPYRVTREICGDTMLGEENGPFYGRGSTWGPNGFDLAVDQFNNQATQDYWIMIVDVRDGTIKTEVVDSSAFYPSWSPDGRYIYYTGGVFSGGGFSRNTPDGSNPLLINPDNDFDGILLTWSPTGTHFTTQKYVYDADGAHPIAIPGTSLGVWSPDGRYVLFDDAGITRALDATTGALGTLVLPDGAVFGGWQPLISNDNAPTVVGVPGRAPNANGWYNGNVTINWVATDDSGTPTDPPNTVASIEGRNVVYTSAPSCDSSGHCATGSITISLDKTKPVLSPVVVPTDVLLGGPVSITPHATDALSGVATQTCGAGNTGSIGTKSVNCSATDRAGNSATAAKSYAVHYRWDGFLQPINDLAFNPTMSESRFRLGSTVQVMLKLKRFNGTALQASVAPTFSRSANLGACDAITTLETVNNTIGTSGSAFMWTSSTNTYFFNWRTTGRTAGEYRITATLNDGTQRTVDVCLQP